MYSGERERTTVLQHWGGLRKVEEREGDQRVKELECSQGSGAEQRVLV